MRLGNWVCCLTPGTKTYQAYNEPIVFERHRHRYEFNNEYRKRMESNGLIVSGRSELDELPEAIESPEHEYVLGVQWHPEADDASAVVGSLVRHTGELHGVRGPAASTQ